MNQAEEKEKINQKKIESLENNFMAISKALANLQELFYQNMDCLESRVNNRLNLLKDQVSDYSNLSSIEESNQSRIGNLESDILKLESRLAENSRRQLNKTENSDKPLRTRILELEKKVETIENKIYLNVCRCKSTPIISSPKDQYYDIEADSVGKSTPCQHSPGIRPQPENIFIMHPTPENTFSNLDNVFSDSHPTQPNNKPINLPKFDRNGNVHTFLRLFENSMSKASNADKATTVVNCLDTASIELVMPHFTTNHWTFKEAKDAIITEFGNAEQIATKKMEFLGIEFTEGESLADFADQFYASCQYLSGVGSLSEYDSKIAMTNALKPYHKIHIAMLPALVNNYKPINLVQYLKRIGQEFGPPKLSQFKAKSNRLSKEKSVTSN